MGRFAKTRENMLSFLFAFDRREEMVFKNLFPMLLRTFMYQTRISDARLIFQVGHTEQMKLMAGSIHHVTTLSVYPPIFGKRDSVAVKCCALSLDNLHLMQGKTHLGLSLI